MHIVYLPSAIAGLEWFRLYYTQVFPEGEAHAIRQYEKMKTVLLVVPHAGHPIGTHDSREYVVPKTPFSVIYRIRGQQIQIMLMLDNRAERLPME